ncbi:MAG: pirin family protein [Vicinamibacteria bacterium]
MRAAPPVRGQSPNPRGVKELLKARPTLEGAGVRLHRAFGFGSTAEHDPFLLLDDFRNEHPEDYVAGFPWHPHRGIETITYVLAGAVEHRDSLGNRGSIGEADIQWMTAGRGIIHQEMPTGDPQGRMHGFQLWANLPSALKMTAPRYQDIKARDVPSVTDDDGTTVRIVCGAYHGRLGPVDDVATRPMYFDVSVPAGKRKSIEVERSSQAFAYVFEGAGSFDSASPPVAMSSRAPRGRVVDKGRTADNRTLVLFDRGDTIEVQAGEEGIRFLLASGHAIGEPVAWYGPVVMNTEDELRHAFAQLDEGTFLRPDAPR